MKGFGYPTEIHRDHLSLDKHASYGIHWWSCRFSQGDWCGLYLSQIGKKHESAKPLYGFGAPLWEVRAADRSGTYRAVYVVHLRGAVYVLHVFQKKAKSGIATARREIEMIRQRLRLAGELDVQAGGEG